MRNDDGRIAFLWLLGIGVIINCLMLIYALSSGLFGSVSAIKEDAAASKDLAVALNRWTDTMERLYGTNRTTKGDR